MFGFNIPVKGKSIHEAMDCMRPLLQLVFYCMDKVKRFKVSKEVGMKFDISHAENMLVYSHCWVFMQQVTLVKGWPQEAER
jgi:hypothetical protein